MCEDPAHCDTMKNPDRTRRSEAGEMLSQVKKAGYFSRESGFESQHAQLSVTSIPRKLVPSGLHRHQVHTECTDKHESKHSYT